MQKVPDPRFSHFVAPMPINNDRFLTATDYLKPKGGCNSKDCIDYHVHMMTELFSCAFFGIY